MQKKKFDMNRIIAARIQVKKRDLVTRHGYSVEKANILYDRAINAGTARADGEFPEDPEEAWVWIDDGANYKVGNSTKEGVTVKGNVKEV